METPTRCRARACVLVPALVLACREPAAVPPEPETGSSSGAEPEEGTSGETPPELPLGCGNGVLEDDEECDLGFANAADGACTPECALPRCGDGLLAADETCDEGEANGGPTCSETCTRPTRLRWSTTIGSTTHGWDLAVAMVPVGEGSVVVARYMDEESSRVVLERHDPDGSRPWSRPLEGPLRHYGLSAHLVPTADDGVLLSIFADEEGVEGSERVELRRLDEQGELRWRHVVVADALGQPVTGHVTTAGSQVVLAAVLEVGVDDYQTRIVRLDDEGTVLRERMVDETLRSVVGASDGGLFAHGSGRLMGWDADDALQWSVLTSPLGTVSLALDGQDRPVIARHDISGARLLQAYSADGQLRWEAELELLPRALAVGPDDALAVAGTADAEPMGLPTNSDLGLETFDADGTRRWLERIDGPGHGEDAAEGVAITANGMIWVCGDVSVPFEERDAWIGRFGEELR